MAQTKRSKRKLPFIISSDSNTQNKRRKLNDNTTPSSMHDKMCKIAQDDRIYDIVFIVGINDEIESIYGIKALFAAHSEVLRNMLFGGMIESIKNKVIINDITIDAFKYIKQYTHFLNPSLKYKHVIDILYVAQKYMIQDIVKQCKLKILSINDMDTFYLLMDKMANYAPSTFESILNDILNCHYIQICIDDIIHDKERFNKLAIFELKLLIQAINDEFIRYKTVKSYCNANKNDNDLWQTIFGKNNFNDLINFDDLSMNQLLIEIRNDQILTEKAWFHLIYVKTIEIQKKSNELDHDNKILTNDLIKSRKLNENLNEEMEEMQTKIDELNEIINNNNNLEDQIDELYTENEEQLNRINEYEKDEIKLKTKIEKIEKRNKIIIKQKKEMKEKMDKLEKNYKNLSNENEGNIELIKENKKDISRLKCQSIRDRGDWWFNF